MHIFVTPTFERAVKKLHQKQKVELDEAVKAVAGDVNLGEAKVGDLAGIRVYKFRMVNQLWLRRGNRWVILAGFQLGILLDLIFMRGRKEAIEFTA